MARQNKQTLSDLESRATTAEQARRVFNTLVTMVTLIEPGAKYL